MAESGEAKPLSVLRIESVSMSQCDRRRKRRGRPTPCLLPSEGTPADQGVQKSPSGVPSEFLLGRSTQIQSPTLAQKRASTAQVPSIPEVAP